MDESQEEIRSPHYLALKQQNWLKCDQHDNEQNMRKMTTCEFIEINHQATQIC